MSPALSRCALSGVESRSPTVPCGLSCPLLCPAVSWLVLCPALPWLVLCPALPWLVLCPALPCPVVPRCALSCALLCPAVPCPAPWPVSRRAVAGPARARRVLSTDWRLLLPSAEAAGARSRTGRGATAWSAAQPWHQQAAGRPCSPHRRTDASQPATSRHHVAPQPAQAPLRVSGLQRPPRAACRVLARGCLRCPRADDAKACSQPPDTKAFVEL